MAVAKKAAAKKTARKKTAAKKAVSKRRVNPDNRKFEHLLNEHGSHCTFQFGHIGITRPGRINVQDGRVYICNDVTGTGQIEINNMGYHYAHFVGRGTTIEQERAGVVNFKLGRKDTTLPRIRVAAGFGVTPTAHGWSFGCGAVKASVREVDALIAYKQGNIDAEKEIAELQEQMRQIRMKQSNNTVTINRLINSAATQNVNVRNADLEFLKALRATR